MEPRTKRRDNFTNPKFVVCPDCGNSLVSDKDTGLTLPHMRTRDGSEAECPAGVDCNSELLTVKQVPPYFDRGASVWSISGGAPGSNRRRR